MARWYRSAAATLLLAALGCLPAALRAATPQAQLLAALRADDAPAVRRLLAQPVELNRPLADGSSLLAWAVESQDLRLVQWLLQRGAAADGSGSADVTPLVMACQRGDTQILQALLKAGAKVTLARRDGITPLALCAGNAATAVVAEMLRRGAPADAPDSRGQTPLMFAAAMGRVENFRLLVAHCAQVNRVTRAGFTPLFFALKSHLPLAADAALEAGANLDYVAPDGTSVVQMALYQKNFAFAARLVERGADLAAIDRNGNRLLHAAVLGGDAPLTRLLLAQGADPNALTGPSRVKVKAEANFRAYQPEAPRMSPLLLAAEGGYAELMQLLVQAGADPGFRNTDGANVLLAAAVSGRLAALQAALELAPDVNTTMLDGQTPLHRLLGGEAGPETYAMLQLLARQGARTDIKSAQGQTPADVAAQSADAMKALFSAAFASRSAALPTGPDRSAAGALATVAAVP